MNLSLKTKYLLTYGLSPFFTGVLAVSIIGLYFISLSPKDFNIALIFQAIWGLFCSGLFALILFCIPALITGNCMFVYRGLRTIYQLLLSIFIGFICPFILIFLIGQMSKEAIGFCLLFGVLGALTSFLITLKLIYYPFKESN